MKKITGILAVAAMATSLFAADFSAGARLSGEVLKYDGNSEGVTAISIKGDNNPWNKPFALSVSSDVAGASWKFTDNVTVATGVTVDEKKGSVDVAKKGHVLATSNYQIWFKPVDMLTVKVGNIAESMNTESIDWGGRVLNYDSFGYECVVNTNGITFALSLVPGEGNSLITKAKGADVAVGEVNAYFAYGADFGTISAMADFKSTFKEIAIAAGYKNTFDPVTIFADVAFKTNTDSSVSGLVVDADAVYNQDAINFQAYVKADMANLSNIGDTLALTAIAKFTYALDAGKVYVYFKDGNLMAKDFACTVKPGFTGNVGAMGYEVAAQFDIAKKVTVSVPVSFDINF